MISICKLIGCKADLVTMAKEGHNITICLCGTMLSPDKPIRMGWTVDKLANKRALGGYCIHNHLTKVEKYSYTDTSKGKNYNIC